MNKRIVFLMRNINLLGGVETITIAYANALIELGYEVDIINLYSEADIGNEKTCDALQEYNLELKNNLIGQTSIIKKIFSLLDDSIKIKSYLKKKYKNESICFITTNPVYSLYVPRKWINQVIIQLHGSVDYILNNFILTALSLKLVKNKVKSLVFLTRANAELACEKKIASPQKTEYIYNFFTPQLTYDPRMKKKIAIMPTRFSAEKQVDKAIRNFANVLGDKTDWVFNIYGAGEKEMEYQQLISELKMEENIFLLKTTSEIEALLQTASIYINTSEAEGFSMSMLEAMSYGLAVVTYNNAIGLDEIITNNVNGFIVDKDDDRALQNVLKNLFDNQKLLDDVGKKARQKSEEFSLTNSVSKLINIIH